MKRRWLIDFVDVCFAFQPAVWSERRMLIKPLSIYSWNIWLLTMHPSLVLHMPRDPGQKQNTIGDSRIHRCFLYEGNPRRLSHCSLWVKERNEIWLMRLLEVVIGDLETGQSSEVEVVKWCMCDRCAAETTSERQQRERTLFKLWQLTGDWLDREETQLVELGGIRKPLVT